ncbi:MAG TPA: hypothetical protein VF155_02920 [Candidatus Dormibacteraeota bacterium]
MSARVRLADIAQARSGDKGDLANVALFAPTDAMYEAFRREVTRDRVRQHFGRFVKGEVDRYEVPNVRALNFVLHQALDGGAARSLRSDPLGKSYGSLLLRMEIDVDEGELAGMGKDLGAPSGPKFGPAPHGADGRSPRP